MERVSCVSCLDLLKILFLHLALCPGCCDRYRCRLCLVWMSPPVEALTLLPRFSFSPLGLLRSFGAARGPMSFPVKLFDFGQISLSPVGSFRFFSCSRFSLARRGLAPVQFGVPNCWFESPAARRSCSLVFLQVS
jgi:hypothetical protein